MKVEIYGWEVGMRKVQLGDFLAAYAGIERSNDMVYGLFEAEPKNITFDVRDEDVDEVSEKLQNCKVKYRFVPLDAQQT